jgi:hypothetical protein
MTKVSSIKLIRLLAAGMLATLLSTACSDDDDPNPSNPGGSSGKGGSSGTGATGGTAGRGGTGGIGASGGTTGTGGTGATGGTAGKDGGPTDGGPEAGDAGCPQGEVLRYEAVGCDVRPRCGPPSGDACVAYACSCAGTTIGGCDYYTQPIRHYGPCPDASDGGPNEGGPDADTGPNDAGPDGSDGGCPTGQVLRYETAGCNAQPRCGSPVQDACLGYACSCRGTLLTGCDYFTEPYSARGMCDASFDGPLFDSGPG